MVDSSARQQWLACNQSHIFRMPHDPDYYDIPDVRDGLTELERTILFVLHEARKEFGDRHIHVALIWGRVIELIDASREEFMRTMEELERRGKEKRYPS